jgi:hypothetical protein
MPQTHPMKALADISHGRKFVRLGQAFLASTNDRAYYLDRDLAVDDSNTLNTKAPQRVVRRATPAPAPAPAPAVANTFLPDTAATPSGSPLVQSTTNTPLVNS